MTKTQMHSSEEQRGTRQPYEPPRIEESAAFDQLVLACATAPADFECQIAPMPPNMFNSG